MQLKFRREHPTKNRKGFVLPILIIVVVFLTTHWARHRDADAVASTLQTVYTQQHIVAEEQLPVFELAPPFSTHQLPHLTPIDPSHLVPTGSYPIDIAHKNGYFHEGHVLYVMDSSGKLLFLQRSSTVVTCPGTWSILGEHSIVGENKRETVVRGVEEELGFIALNFDESNFKGAWTADFHPRNNMQDTLHVTIQNLTEFPLYYIRHYGPRNDNRIDRQLTYLWVVQFPKKHDEISWQLDDEVADHKWISLDEVGTWLSQDARNSVNNTASSSGGGSLHDDDGPDEGDFCHQTIRSLYEKGLENML